MAKTLKDFLLTAEKTYSFRLKFTFELTSSILEKIERVLKRWDMINISKPSRIIFQKDTGMEISNIETYYVDIEVKYPASPFILLNQLKDSLNISESNIKIIPMQNGEEFHPKEIKDLEDFQPLLTNSDNKEVEKIDHANYYGQDYNNSLIKTLTDLRKTLYKGPINPIPEDKTEIDPISGMGSHKFSNIFPGGPK